tara:strand:- start:492 stop:722 length:231 start_codon:yes stop_codon:yes gene_type:complete
MIDTLHIDDLDGTVTLFKSTDEGTETIAVFDEEHREVIEYLVKQVKRLRETIKAYLDLDMDSLEFCRIMREMGVIE